MQYKQPCSRRSLGRHAQARYLIRYAAWQACKRCLDRRARASCPMGHAPSESNSRYLDGMRAVLSWCCRPTCGVDNRNSRIRLTQPLRYVFGPGLSGGTMQVMKQVSLGVPAIKQVKNQTPFLDRTIPPADGRGRGGFEVEARLESSAVGLGVVPAPLAPYWRYPRRPHMLLTGRTHGLHRDTRRLQDATHRLHNTDAKRTQRRHTTHTVHKLVAVYAVAALARRFFEDSTSTV